MYCPECGKVVPDGANFCPSCGRDLTSMQYTSNSYTTTTGGPAYYGQPPVVKKTSGKKVAAVVIVAIVVLAIFVMPDFDTGSRSDGPLHGQVFVKEFDDTVSVDTETLRCVTEVGGFASGDAYFGFVPLSEEDKKTYGYSTGIRLYLSDVIGGSFAQFRYVISGTMDAVVDWKTEPFMTMYGSNYGNYHVVVQCRNLPSDTPTEYVFDYNVSHYVSSAWEYLGGTFGFEYKMDDADFSPYVPASTEEKLARDVNDYTKSPSFIVNNKVTRDVEHQLRAFYEEAIGPVTNDQDYADFILAYVQTAFLYVSDSFLYQQGEYFAYPVETLLYGAGDCEDTSILCAALFKSAGYDSALLLLPGHAMTGISLPGFKKPTHIDSGYEIISQEVAGKMYYACETTCGKPLESGIVPIDNGHRYSTDLNKGYAGYGSFTFYPAEA
ncbi:MAG: zinc-ribbon domain-containing protein [archaeon]|nr:zinc-ribbon domain-containing protein [archaeon]